MSVETLVAKELTIVEIDEHLSHISNVIKYSKRREKKKCFLVADTWLDRRLELMDVESLGSE